jgi:phosphohistidine swiveling domain-containing protein
MGNKLEKMDPGDISVMCSFPTGFEVMGVIPSRTALVKETGSAGEHLALILREFGIPYVVLKDATKLLRDGDLIEVDGNTGGVTKFEEIEFNIW